MLETTSTILLEGLFDSKNDHIWRMFDDRYRPVIERFGRKMGLSPADSADAAQEALITFVNGYRKGQYDRSRGRLRDWIFAIARSRIVDQMRKKGRRAERRGESAFVNLAQEDRLEELWEEEWRQSILRAAIAELRSNTKMNRRTIDAFELLAIQNKSPREVAEAMHITTNDVYLAKHRALEHLQSLLATLERDW